MHYFVPHDILLKMELLSSLGHKKSIHWPPHESNAQQKRPPHAPFPPGGGHPSPPLTGTRGYPYPQDPTSRCSTSSTSYITSVVASSPHLVHSAGGGAIYASPNHLYRDTHFQIDNRQQSDSHHIDRYPEQQHVHNVRRRLSLRPTPEYSAVLERERYMDAFRYQYDRDVTVPYSSNAMAARTLKPQAVSVHTPSEMDAVQPIKRPRLAVEPKAPVHQPLVVDTRNVVIKKDQAYTPQVEAISPTLPSEEGRCDSPMRLLKENILTNIKQLDKEINQVESQVSKLRKKMHDLEVESSKPSVSKEVAKEVSPIESKQMSIAQIIYSENRSKAQESHAVLEKLGQKVEIPMYNQPSDTAVYHENKRKYQIFKSRLLKWFKKRHKERELREKHITDSYSKFMQEWLKKLEKKESNTTKKAKDAKLREFFEKQFPELKKQREDKERITRVSQRIRSDAEWEEIIDGLQEQELEEKKMRSYAVIPPILLDNRQRRMWYINKNGLIEELSQEYKEKQMLNIWTDQEKAIFREKYLQHPKNFAFIASCLDRKSVSDCVQYYYLSKKSENYKQLLRKHSVRKRTRALVKAPQSQQLQQPSQSTGVTTRQQEDAKALAFSSTNTSLIPNIEMNTQASMECSTATTTLLTNCIASSESGDIVTTTAVDVPSSSTLMDTPLSDITSENKEPVKISLPNNIRKKKEIDQLMENKGDVPSDSDTASDHQNENNASQPCAVCKMVLDNFNQSRPLTKSNCSMFGIKESQLVGDMRVCASCRFKSVRKRCPVPTCKTPRRKVKRLRPLPGKLAELPKEAKEAIIAELQIPTDVNKCCSACFNRIIRKLENNSANESEPSENSRWTEEEMESAKHGLRQHGTDWEAISKLVGTKNKDQCRNFYFNYKRKFGLEDIVQEYKKLKGDKDDNEHDGKPPPIVTDEEESGETTSSCDEDDRADRCSSDTASAPSPVDKILVEDKSESQKAPELISDSNQPNSVGTEESRTRSLPQLDTSPKCLPDYDSSATVSADESQNPIDGEGRESSPRVIHSAHGPLKISSGCETPRKSFQSPMPLPKETENKQPDPLVKTLLQDPKIGAGQPDLSSSYIQACKAKADEPTCVRDLIYQAIEMSLQYPAKQGRNSSPIPPSAVTGLKQETADIAIVEPKKEVDSSVPFPPTAHSGSRHPSRPGSHHMDMPMDCEVQDLSKKVKSRDVSPVKEIKRDRVMTPVRPSSGSNGSSSHLPYYVAPPPAHCNTFRTSQPPPPALSPHYIAEPHHDSYFPRANDPRGKTFISERPHSQPPHLVAQSASMSGAPLPTHAKPVPIKATVPPPPPLVASKPTQMSPKMPFKDRLVSIPPAGSITQGTPVNQQSIPVPPTNLPPARYEGFLRQLPVPQSKDGGSITLGTPVPHDSIKRVPSTRPEAFAQIPDNLVRQSVPALYEPGVMEYCRQVAPGGQPYSFPPAYATYPTNVSAQRPPYANESQLSSKQIMIDFNTSKQMQLRRGGNGAPEKEVKVSPRSSDSSPAPIIPQESHLHPMYPPANYQTSSSSHYSNHVPSNYQPIDSRYNMHHRSPSVQMDRTRSPSGVESPLNSNYAQHPGKRSPSLSLASSRQNVIHRSITWGTGKPSVIQSPQSASPRTPDMRSETVSPANVRKSTPSPRHPQPMVYPAVPPSGHDAFNTLVNAAVAQPSLAVPKDGKRSPTPNMHVRQEVKSPRERQVVEGLEKTMIDMHQRPRSYTDSGPNVNSLERGRNDANSSEQAQLLNENHRYVGSVHNSYDPREHQRLAEKQQMLMNEQPSTLRLGNMREPFSREQFERQMRQTNVSAPRERSNVKKEEERVPLRERGPLSENQTQNYPSHSQQSELDNEASKIFSQSFQKDAPKSNSSPRGFTAANLIDAIITRQINQNVEAPTNKSAGIDLFNQYHTGYDDNKMPQKTNNAKQNPRTEVVTIDDEPENEKTVPSSTDRSNAHGRSPNTPPNNNTHGPVPGVPMSYSGEKVFTLSEHIAAIISKDYNSPSDVKQSQPLFSNSQSPANTTTSASSRTSYVIGGSSGPHSSANAKQLEGIAAVLPTEGVLVNSNIPHNVPDHSAQNCPGNGCSYHTHSWKLRRALQQEREREHRSPSSNENIHKQNSNQNSDAVTSQEERQIIRVAQSSPNSQASRAASAGPYGVEPISPPSQVNDNGESNNRNPSNQSITSGLNQPPVWTNNPSLSGIFAARHIYAQEYPDGIPSSIAHYPVPSPANSNPVQAPTRPHQQQQVGLSPFDYVRSRIVEVMRTTTDDEPEAAESRRPQSAMSHSDEREHLQHVYRFQPGAEREVPSERPCSTGNGPPLLQGQRYSPAMSRYSPIPPRPSSAVERVPSRNSTPGELSRQHKRGSEGHIVTGDWRDNQTVSSRASSRSVSPNTLDHPDNVSRKKTRAEGTYIPESTTERAPVLLPQNSLNVHRSSSISEAPRLSSSNQSAQVLECQSASKGIVSPQNEQYLPSPQTESDCFNKFRIGDRPETQWSLMNNHSRTTDAEPVGRLNEPMSTGAASSTMLETYAANNRSDPSAKNSDHSDIGTRQSPVTSSSVGLQEPSQSSPSASSQGQRSTPSTPLGMGASSSSGHYSPFGTPSGSVSSSTSNMFSSASSLPPPASPHIAYSTFSGMGTTYAYPYSALSVRSLSASTTHGSTPVTNNVSSVTSSRISPMPVSNSSRNSPSPLSRSNQPPPLLSSQYEPLSDED
ncbi:nuclear receptor corepressor 1-like isoform X2 [Uloborus diversus]|uniref:nuclear receptor corepressor 1-like isoform X2 n=1 Tax=Uloborus diversus TaxID=327109 RepID=UPI0024095AE3|nr:nuclear receptor corepressor 1-like isoform X2 [Uloborus diversus]